MAAKVKFTSRSLERHLVVPRARAWETLLAALDEHPGLGAPELGERVLSFEPPWRRSSRIEGSMPLEFYERTFVLRDDGDECHLSCGVVVDPEPTEEGLRFLDTALGSLGELMDRVVTRAQD